VNQVKKQQTTIAVLTALGLAMGSASFSAQAIQAGDMFGRLTLTSVMPNDDADPFSDVAVVPKVDDSTRPGATFVYMYTDNIGLEVLAALPFKHDISVDGMGVIGETKHLPPTFSVQYYFNPQSKVRPFVGLGLNYTTFFSSKTIDGLGGDLDLDDSFGLAAQVGIDYDLDEKWFLTADVRYMNIETTATNSAAGSTDVEINPTVVSVGVGYKF
jgi:outer membrane protein